MATNTTEEKLDDAVVSGSKDVETTTRDQSISEADTKPVEVSASDESGPVDAVAADEENRGDTEAGTPDLHSKGDEGTNNKGKLEESAEKEVKEESTALAAEVADETTTPAAKTLDESVAKQTKEETTASQAPVEYEYPKDVTFGCLIFSPAGNGDLFIKWSNEPLPGSLALFMTKKKIPPFKFKTPTELINNIDHNRKKFVNGLAAFFKETDSYDGTFQILDNSDHGFGDVWLCIGGKKWGKVPAMLRKVQLGEIVDISTVEAVALVPRASLVFNGLLNIDFMRFLNTGTREGAVWHRS